MKKQESKSKTVAEIVTEQIIEQLEKGVCPWQKTWTNSPQNAISKKDYRGINRLITSIVASNHTTPYFLTFKQAQELKGNIRKGEHGFPVIFWKLLKYGKVNEDTMEITEKNIPFMRYYTLFNLDQTEGIDLSKFALNKQVIEPMEQAEKIITDWKDKPEIRKIGCQPCYKPCSDVVEMPQTEYFKNQEGYYSTLFHELTHSTGHEKRLDRPEVSSSMIFKGSENYAMEELVAELGASFLCSHCSIDRTIDNSASYISSWLKVLKDDRKMIITASARAEKAMSYILGGVKS